VPLLVVLACSPLLLAEGRASTAFTASNQAMNPSCARYLSRILRVRNGPSIRSGGARDGLSRVHAEDDGVGYRGSFVFDPDADVKKEAENVVKEAMESPDALENSSESDLFHELALVLKQSKLFGIANEDIRLYPSIEKAARNLEIKFGYQYQSEDLFGDWKLLFTTSAAYKSMQGMSGLSRTPGSSLKALFQQLRKEDVPQNVFNDALRSLNSMEEAQSLSESEPSGTATTVEILEVFGSAQLKNEMRGIFFLDDVDDDVANPNPKPNLTMALELEYAEYSDPNSNPNPNYDSNPNANPNV